MTEEKVKRKRAKKEQPATVTFPDGREKFVHELTDEDIFEAQAIINAASEDIVRGAAKALEQLLNPFGLSCKLISFTFPTGASPEEVDELLVKAVIKVKPENQPV